MSTVLVVDDKEILRDSVAVALRRPGFAVVSAGDAASALEVIARKRPDVVVTDLKMPGMTGIELIERIREVDEDLPIILMTAYGTIETAVRALKLGAFDYITKPFEGDELVVSVKRAVEHARLKRENEVLRAAASGSGASSVVDGEGPSGAERLVGESEAMRTLKGKIAAIASSQGTVLVSGESGTGKEVVARAIHEMSSRSSEPMLAVNCAAMSEALLESELFGHEKGAFTGAEKLRKGRFELAHRGTLLLDEISEVKPQVQAKLLRVLQERSFERVGSSTTIGVDVRVVATTNRRLPEEVAAGRFRQDLYFRLNVLPVHVPSLRERIEDVELLAPHFVAMASRREGRPAKRITPRAMSVLMQYTWPGNVRELQNLCERAVVLAPGEDITADLIASWLGGARAEPKVVSMKATPMSQSAGWRRSAGTGTDGMQAVRTGSPGGGAGGPGGGGPSPGVGHGGGHGAGHGGGAGSGLSFGVGGFGGGPALAEAPDMGVSVLDDQGSGPRPLADIEREVIVRALEHFGGHRQKTAHALGIGVRTLGLKLKKWKEERLVAQSL